ncbi:MAG: peptidoglycan-binding domain-containing protein, partial [Acidimicrobiales bacterium]
MPQYLPSLPQAEASNTEGFPFARGSSGAGVGDLQQRLTRLGYSIGDDTTRQFGPGTEIAVVTFQRDRGLRGDGICGAHTWSSVVEAGFSLGDRLLYRRAPMLHGDDVA